MKLGIMLPVSGEHASPAGITTIAQTAERLGYGFGQGWVPQEFATANVPMKRRGAGLDEAVAAIRACWGPDPVEYDGRFYAIEASEINPKPVRGHIPIIIGAVTDPGIDRAARIADGIIPVAFTLDSITEHAARFRATAESFGRDTATLTVAAQSNATVSAEPAGRDRQFLGGSPRQVADDIEQLRDHAIDTVMFTQLPAETSVRIDVLEELRTLVPPA